MSEPLNVPKAVAVRPWPALLVLLASVVLAVPVIGQDPAKDGDSSASDEALRERRLEDMQGVAAGITVEVGEGTEFRPVAFVKGARFRYNHPKTNCDDATVWLWGDSGRPVALLTLERTLADGQLPRAMGLRVFLAGHGPFASDQRRRLDLEGRRGKSHV